MSALLLLLTTYFVIYYVWNHIKYLLTWYDITLGKKNNGKSGKLERDAKDNRSGIINKK